MDFPSQTGYSKTGRERWCTIIYLAPEYTAIPPRALILKRVFALIGGLGKSKAQRMLGSWDHTLIPHNFVLIAEALMGHSMYTALTHIHTNMDTYTLIRSPTLRLSVRPFLQVPRWTRLLTHTRHTHSKHSEDQWPCVYWATYSLLPHSNTHTAPPHLQSPKSLDLPLDSQRSRRYRFPHINTVFTKSPGQQRERERRERRRAYRTGGWEKREESGSLRR